jgi:antitoxin VapB
MIKAKLFKTGQNQAIRIPKEFEFKGVNEVSICKEGDRIIIEPVRKSWLSYAELPKADADFMSERPELL